MSEKSKQSNENKKLSYAIPIFLVGGIGTILGLVAYVKDWL